jgi:hypothetical protein
MLICCHRGTPRPREVQNVIRNERRKAQRRERGLQHGERKI